MNSRTERKLTFGHSFYRSSRTPLNVKQHAVRSALGDVRLQGSEIGITLFRWNDNFAVEYDLVAGQMPDRFLEGFESRRPVVTPPRIKPRLPGSQMDLQAVAVELYLVHEGGQGGLDKPGKRGAFGPFQLGRDQTGLIVAGILTL
jgi:hypothetical protein